jgi:hypothetical protein
VVIRDFHFHRALVGPAKTNAILVIDPDTVLAFPVTRQLLESIRRRRRQVAQFHRGIQIIEFPPRNSPN